MLPGASGYAAMRDQYMRSGSAFVLVYSITSLSSFQEIKTFHDRLCRVKDEDDPPAVLVGNKLDLEDERQVAREQGEELAKTLRVGIPDIE